MIIRVFCPRAGVSLLIQATKLQFLHKGRFSTSNSRIKIVVLQVWRLCLLYLFFSVKERKNTFTLLLKCWMTTRKTHPARWFKPVHQQNEKREKYTRAGPQSHTQKRNSILVEEQIYVQYICSWPLRHIFEMSAFLAWTTVARDGKSIYISLWKYIDASLGRAVFIMIYKFKYK